MSKERLSRLQKWILKTLYVLTEDKSGAAVAIRDLKAKAIHGFGGSPFPDDRRLTRNTLDATFSRAIRNMADDFGFELGLSNKELVIRLSVPPPLDWKARSDLADKINKPQVLSAAMPKLMPTLNFQHATHLGLTDKGREIARTLLNVKNPGLNNKESQGKDGGVERDDRQDVT